MSASLQLRRQIALGFQDADDLEAVEHLGGRDGIWLIGRAWHLCRDVIWLKFAATSQMAKKTEAIVEILLGALLIPTSSRPLVTLAQSWLSPEKRKEKPA